MLFTYSKLSGWGCQAYVLFLETAMLLLLVTGGGLFGPLPGSIETLKRSKFKMSRQLRRNVHHYINPL